MLVAEQRLQQTTDGGVADDRAGSGLRDVGAKIADIIHEWVHNRDGSHSGFHHLIPTLDSRVPSWP